MPMKKTSYIKLYLSIFIGSLSVFVADAQKLPNKQEISLWAPANIKIDGKMNEWGDKLQAYNKNTLVYYTIANDDDNLYLVVRIENPDIINKAISGAITLTVNPHGKQSDEKCPAISFPLLNSASGTAIRTNASLLTGRAKHIQEVANATSNDTKLKSKETPNDSLLRVADERLSEDTKEIKISDIDGITDTVTGTHTDKMKQFWRYPLYVLPGYYIPKENNLGIKAAASFEGNWKYTYELAVPLKYLKVQPEKKFSYNIRLNGPMYKTGKPTAGYPVMFSLDQVNHVATRIDQDLIEATDFWGEYTLAKKP